MDETRATGFVGRLAALSQPTRLKIVEVIAQGGPEGIAAGKIAQAVRCPASTLSFHLKELSRAGLLEAIPDGRFIRYSVKPGGFAELAAFINALPGRAGPGEIESAPRKSSAKRTARRRVKKPAKQGDQTQQEEQMSIFGD